MRGVVPVAMYAAPPGSCAEEEGWERRRGQEGVCAAWRVPR